MPLEKDNPSLRDMSNKLDAAHCGKAWYDKAVRPIIHGTYHAARALGSSNAEEWARAKDQYGTFGTGQSQTEYLKAYRENNSK